MSVSYKILLLLASLLLVAACQPVPVPDVEPELPAGQMPSAPTAPDLPEGAEPEEPLTPAPEDAEDKPAGAPVEEEKAPEPVLALTPVAEGEEVILDDWVYESDGELLLPKRRIGAQEIMPEIQPSISLAARQIAAQALGLETDEVQVLSIEQVMWRDSSLGCPQPGYFYAQVITPGYKVTVRVGERTYQVHTDERGFGAICPPVADR